MFNKKIKVIWFCQNIPVYYIIQNKSIFTNFKKFLEKYYIIPFIDVIISNSKFIQNEVKKYYSRKSELIYPSIDLDFFKNTKVIKEERSLFINSRLVK
jgi:glycosyltransferase involved in cell wall biosynthesis